MNHGSVSGASGCTSIECQPARFAPTMSVRTRSPTKAHCAGGTSKWRSASRYGSGDGFLLLEGTTYRGKCSFQFLPPPVGAVGDDAHTVCEQAPHDLDVRQELLIDAHAVEPAQRLVGIEGYGADAAVIERPRVDLGDAVGQLVGVKYRACREALH